MGEENVVKKYDVVGIHPDVLVMKGEDEDGNVV